MLKRSDKLTVRNKPLPEIEIFVNDWENSMQKPSEHFDDYFSYENNKNSFYSFLSYLNPMNLYYYFFGSNNNINSKFPNRKIFVVSVLKTNFYWNKKYLTYKEKNIYKKKKFIEKPILFHHIIYLDQNAFG